MEEKKFNSVEEVITFLSTKEGSLGALNLSDAEGRVVSIPFKDLVEKLGLEKAATLIYGLRSRLNAHRLSPDHIIQLFDKAMQDTNSLTDEEAYLLYSSMRMVEGQKNESDYFTAGLLNALAGAKEMQDVSTLMRIFLMIMQLMIQSSIKDSPTISLMQDNSKVSTKFMEHAMTAISYPKDIDEVVLAYGLMGTLLFKVFNSGKRTIFNQDLDMVAMAKSCDIPLEFIYQCPGCKEHTCKTCGYKNTKQVSEFPVDDTVDRLYELCKDKIVRYTNTVANDLKEETVEINDILKEFSEKLDKNEKSKSLPKEHTPVTNIKDYLRSDRKE